MKAVICWLRRDLRLHDNETLFRALESGYPVIPVFIFDTVILEDLPNDDKRLVFITQTILEIKHALQKSGSDLLVFQDKPESVFRWLFSRYEIAGVFAGIDYEAYSIQRDSKVREMCREVGIPFHSFHDHVCFNPDRVVKPDGTPYHVFTPYRNRWLLEFRSSTLPVFPSETLTACFFRREQVDLSGIPVVEGFRGNMGFPSPSFDREVILKYHETRDYPGLDKTTRLGIHLRFGTVSVRQLIKLAADLNPVFLNELIWREFYQMILFFHPGVETHSFKPGYDRVIWLNHPDDFRAWCDGRTGYPLVDAGMRQLVATGYMHNRIRMVTASFLTKHLLVDWRWGERFFSRYLLDYELASNNGGWQWAAGSGCDAAPYFRVFNPDRQQKQFDPQETYIRRWLPEFQPGRYPHKPIVAHEFARQRAINFLREAQRK